MPEETIYVGFDCPVELNRMIEKEARAHGGCSKAAVVRAKLIEVFFPLGWKNKPTPLGSSTQAQEARP